jgi:putative glycosyltransferase (TIGR04348 family)
VIVRLVTPASAGSLRGNRITAERWKSLISGLGHRVVVQTEYAGEPADVLVALHARRSGPAARLFREKHPRKPLIVVLTGTDLYRDLPDCPISLHSLELATRLVVLQPEALKALPESVRGKTTVIFQSVPPPGPRPPPRAAHYDICVVGHLRPVKDPFRAALAARSLPQHSRIQILHAGSAYTPEMARAAQAESDANPRYTWLGQLPFDETQALIARSRLMVLSSIMEGGANVVSEALVCGTPVLASRISGTVGQLGPGYPGYFEVGATDQLATLMARAETDPAFAATLDRWCLERAPQFAPARESEAWRRLLQEVALA